MSPPKSSRNSTFRWEKRSRDSSGIWLFSARSKHAKISAAFCVTSPVYSSSSRFRYSLGLVWKTIKQFWVSHRRETGGSDRTHRFHEVRLHSGGSPSHNKFKSAPEIQKMLDYRTQLDSPGLFQLHPGEPSLPCSDFFAPSSTASPASQHRTTSLWHFLQTP